VTNPPYGERLMEKQEAEELYRDFGRATEGLPSGWRINLLSSHTEFERTFGRKADKKRKLYNGMIKCDLFQYDVKRGKKGRISG
jgi:putative N6-adenine-specific DNA methylase